jgi:F-type H+-transporting ATPase subunit b
MGSDSELIPNFTLFIQMAIFFGCYFMLNKFVFGPYLALLEIRRAKTIGLKEKAVHDKQHAEKLRTDYEAFLKSERKKLVAFMDEERKKVADEEKVIIQESRAAVGKGLQTLRERLRLDVEKTREDLSPLVSEYSSQIASKLLGRKVNVSGVSMERNSVESHPVVPG